MPEEREYSNTGSGRGSIRGRKGRMERATPVRKPHTSTADLLTWSEVPPPSSPTTNSSARYGNRSHQVRISAVERRLPLSSDSFHSPLD